MLVKDIVRELPNGTIVSIIHNGKEIKSGLKRTFIRTHYYYEVLVLKFNYYDGKAIIEVENV